MTAPCRTNLVILRGGDTSLHPGWLAGPERDFDIFISYYGQQPQRYQADADYYEMRRGTKWPCIGELLHAHPELLERYEAFWFPDDDLAATTDTLNRMFALFRGFSLQLAQPALTRDSFYSWKLLLQRPEYVLRYVPFVEIMAPVFSRSALLKCRGTFGESSSGYGLDFVWPSLLEPGPQPGMAVLDATPVRHTRPVGGELYRNHPEMDPGRDAAAVVQKYGATRLTATARYTFNGGIARVPPKGWERLWMQLQSWNSLRRLRRKQRRQPVPATSHT